MSVNIPQGELFISSFESDGHSLSMRLVGYFHAESIGPSAVLCISASEVKDIQSVNNFIRDRRTAGEAVYIGAIGSGILIESEFGTKVEIQGASVSVSEDEFNVDELKEIITRVYGWYESETAILRRMKGVVKSVEALVIEQTRRIAAKASTHADGTTAATLYRQHLTFLSRVRTELNK